MLKLMPLIMESEVDQEEDLGKPHILTERGYTFLKAKIDEMNKKAQKWGVPQMTLKVLKEEFIKKKIPVKFGSGQPTTWDDPEKEEKEVTVKQYEVLIDGEPPTVEGYEFIAKVEHTPDGNILNYAPKASSKSIPHEYRTATQQCDVCKTARDRNNTFILKMDKDDPERFPEKRKGDFVMVGSGCLKRFLPNISATALMGYAEMIEALRDSIHESGEMDDDFSGGFGSSGQGNYMDQANLGKWLSAVYLHTGKYISKKKAEEFQSSSTLSDAFSAMNSKVGYERGRDIEDPVHARMRTDEAFRQKVDGFTKEFLDWAKTKDFDTLMNQKPEFADFFHNLKVLSKQETFKSNNAGFFSALFQMFLRDKGELERLANLKAARPNLTTLGTVGAKQRATVVVKKKKEYEGQYGQGLIVTMDAKTNEVDPASGQPVQKEGNLLYFTNPNFELDEGEEAEVEFTVKGHQNNKYTQLPETQITRMKVLKFISNPERNSGKTKVKDLNGVVEVKQVREDMDWRTQQKKYSMYFNFDATRHPEMKVLGDQWGRGATFIYQIPDETTYQSLKQYEGKLVEAKWNLARVSTMDKLVSGVQTPVASFTVLKVLGDIPKPT